MFIISGITKLFHNHEVSGNIWLIFSPYAMVLNIFIYFTSVQ